MMSEIHPRGQLPTLPAPPPRLAAVLLFVAAFATYAPSLANGLTNWDDPEYVDRNPFALQGLGGITEAFASSWHDAWYPLTHAVYCVIQAMAGPSPFAHHLVQILLAAAAIACIPAALAAFGVERRIGFWAALLWMAHPMRVESISWVASLKDIVSLFGVLAAFAAWGHGRKKLAAAAFACAVLGKTTVFPLAFLFVFCDAETLQPRALLRSLGRTAIFWLPAIVFASITASFHLFGDGAAGRAHPGGSLAAAVPSALWLPWWYLLRTALGSHPQAVYALQPVAFFEPRFLVALLLWGAAIAAALWAPFGTRRRRLALLLGFTLPFVPVTGLVPLAFPVADRYALLPSLAVAVCGVLAAEAIALRWQKRHLGVAAVALAIACLLPLNFMRQREWRDSIALWEADRSRAPEIDAVRLNLAGAYGASGRWSEAAAELEAMRQQGTSYRHLFRDLFFAHAALAGMEPGLVLQLSSQIERAGGDARAALGAGAAALAQGYDGLAEKMVEIAQPGAPAAAAELRSRIARARGAGLESGGLPQAGPAARR